MNLRRIDLKVFIVCLDNEPFSVHKILEDAHNWVIGQELEIVMKVSEKYYPNPKK